MSSKAPHQTSIRRRRFLQASAGAAVSLAVSAPALAQRARILRFSSQQPAESIYTRAQTVFADEVAALSSGKIKVENYPNAQLGMAKEMLTGIQLGSISMGLAVPAWYSTYVKQMDVFTLPYLVSSQDRLRQALDGAFGERIKAAGEGAGFKFVGSFLMGPRHIVNNIRPINKPSDMAGLKMRIINSQVYMETFRSMKANPVAIDPSELYLAMQQRVVDGLEYPLPDLVDAKLYEVAKYLSLDAHVTDLFVVAMNKGIWNDMSAEEQGIVTQAMKKTMDWQWSEQPANMAKALEKLKTVMQVNEISAADRELFAQATRPVYQMFEASIGKDLIDQAVRALGPSQT